MSGRSKIYQTYIKEFVIQSSEQLLIQAEKEFDACETRMGDMHPLMLCGILVIASKIDTGFKGAMNDRDKKLIDRIWDEPTDGKPSETYDDMTTPLDEHDIKKLKMMNQLRSRKVVPYIRYMLCCAFIDGVIEDQAAELIDKLYKINMLEDILYHRMLEKDELYTLDQLIRMVPECTNAQLERAIKRLMKEERIYSSETASGVVYGVLDHEAEYKEEPDEWTDKELDEDDEEPDYSNEIFEEDAYEEEDYMREMRKKAIRKDGFRIYEI